MNLLKVIVMITFLQGAIPDGFISIVKNKKGIEVSLSYDTKKLTESECIKALKEFIHLREKKYKKL